MNKYQFRNQLKAQVNRLNQRNVNKLLLAPKKELGYSLRHWYSKYNYWWNLIRKVFFKYSKINMGQWMYFETLSHRDLLIKLHTLIICVYLEKSSVTRWVNCIKSINRRINCEWCEGCSGFLCSAVWGNTHLIWDGRDNHGIVRRC